MNNDMKSTAEKSKEVRKLQNKLVQMLTPYDNEIIGTALLYLFIENSFCDKETLMDAVSCVWDDVESRKKE